MASVVVPGTSSTPDTALILGGLEWGLHLRNDVHRTTDGVNWQRVSGAPWQQRRGGVAVWVYDRVVLVGGADGGTYNLGTEHHTPALSRLLCQTGSVCHWIGEARMNRVACMTLANLSHCLVFDGCVCPVSFVGSGLLAIHRCRCVVAGVDSDRSLLSHFLSRLARYASYHVSGPRLPQCWPYFG